ncbi:MAG TPA: LLM class flavin-dependent oxidoreductase [Ilumatobacteraceae bacterium]|nr:LLM class flavin-dependent oxidoreductase [Ilumatobacteraceae bacterium]
MKFSFWPSNAVAWDELIDLARYTEANGWHAFWFADHFMSQTADDTPGSDPALECWSVLAAIGAAVPRLRLTSMVSPVTIHHPVVLAKRAATIDHISGGRVVLGLGAGWQVNEHAAYGIDLRPVGERVTHFIESIEVIRHLFDDERADFAGRWYTLTDAPFEPKPLQRPLPLLVGTGGDRMMRATARYAQAWNTWGDPAAVAERTERFRAACDSVGTDFDSIHRSAQALVRVTDSDAETERLRAAMPAGRSLVGQPSELIDLLGQYADLGVDEFALPGFTLGATREQRRDNLARFHSDIAAHI